MLFIDNPVGAGYSYVDDLSYLTTTTQEITDDLLVVLRTFLDTHPEFESGVGVYTLWWFICVHIMDSLSVGKNTDGLYNDDNDDVD